MLATAIVIMLINGESDHDDCVDRDYAGHNDDILQQHP